MPRLSFLLLPVPMKLSPRGRCRFCPLLRRCGGSYAETGQTRFRLRDVDAALSGDTAAGVYAAERRTATAVGGCFFACRRYAVVYADFHYRQVKTGVASD